MGNAPARVPGDLGLNSEAYCCSRSDHPRYPADNEIVKEGDQARDVYFLIHGAAQVSSRPPPACQLCCHYE